MDSDSAHPKPLVRHHAVLLAIAYLGFISLGLPDPVAGVAWPSVRETFGLEQESFGLVFLGLGCGYCLSGFFAGKLMHWLGLGNLLWGSSALVALAMLTSGLAPAWPVFVAAAALWGLGSGGIDAGLNAYVPRHFSVRHVNWLHACYSLGATLGPLLMTAMLVQGGRWRSGYVVVGGLLLAMTVQFFITRRWWTDDTTDAQGETGTPRLGLRDALSRRLVWMHTALFFLYVGVEFTVGQWSFTVLTETRSMEPELAGSLAAAYYGSIGVGRVLAGIAAHRFSLDGMLRFSMLMAVAGTALFALASSAALCGLGLIVAGLGLAPVFPCLMARTPQRLGNELAAHAAGFQVSAGTVGAAVVPGLAGLLTNRWGLGVVGQIALGVAILLLVMHELLLLATKPSETAS
jgi:fucose permease